MNSCQHFILIKFYAILLILYILLKSHIGIEGIYVFFDDVLSYFSLGYGFDIFVNPAI